MNKFDVPNEELHWCPGCGDIVIHNTIKQTLTELGYKNEEVAIISGIGQAAKTPHFIKTHTFNGLHGRAIPVATGVKAANPNLKVITVSGDGCVYGEGGNHFIHAIRRNPDITLLVNNNMVYGLTKGQASPTSQIGMITPIQINGVTEEPFNPLAVAIALKASFVARANAGDIKQSKEIYKKALKHKGLAIIDTFQPCVVFNKYNTYDWFKEHTYYHDKTYGAGEETQALKIALDTNKLALGVLYVNKQRKPFEETLPAYKTSKQPLYQRNFNAKTVKMLLEQKRS